MSTKSVKPGEPAAAPVESWQTPAAADVGGTSAEATGPAEGADDVLDVPNFGEFSAESARPTPLDDIAEAEREKAPRD